MMFLVAVPFLEAVAIYFLPQMLGARDLPFPRLSAYGFWCYVIGGVTVFGSIFFLAGARRRLVHVPAAHQPRPFARGSAPTSGCSACRSSRSPRSPPRSS